jgi:hypothetical protein
MSGRASGSPPRNSAGWSDCPPPHTEDAVVPNGISDGLGLKAAGNAAERNVAKRAQRLFHAALVEHLDSFGPRTVDEMTGGFGWFHLRLTAHELVQLVDSAQTSGHVERMPDYVDPLGTLVCGKYLPTDKGLKLRGPRGAGADDLREAAVVVVKQVCVTFKDWWAALGTLVAVLGIGAFWFKAHRGELIAVAILAVLGAVLMYGTRGERELKAAALRWPRLEAYRPCRYAWQTHPWREWFSPVVILAAAGLGAIALLAWVPAVVIALGVAAVARVGYGMHFGPMHRAWVDEVGAVFACREARKRARGARVGAQTADKPLG